MNTCPTCHRERYVGESCQRDACIWADLAGVALELDCLTIPGTTLSGPRAIKERILATHDRLPGGSNSSESSEVRAARMEECGDRTCPEWHPDIRHDHPVPVDPTGDAAMRPSKSEADLGALQTAVDAFVAAVGHLSALSHSRGAPRTWDEAVTDAVLLDDMDAIDTLEMSGQKPRRWVRKAADAIHDIEQIRDRHCPRDATDHERSWTSGLADEECCMGCLKLGLRIEKYRRQRCAGCYGLWKDSAEHTADGERVDPPVELIELLRRIGGPCAEWKRARSSWLQSLKRLTA